MNHYSRYLKNNLLYIILIVLVISLTLTLFIRKEKELTIISRDYPYSIYHSDNYETIDIEILTNSPGDYHFNQEYIISTKLYNHTQELSIDIKDIKISDTAIPMNDSQYYQVIFECAIPFQSNDLSIEMEEVFLEIIYENMETIEISVGEINYLFRDVQTSHIVLSNLSATHEIIDGYNTIGGINIELANTSSDNIMITDIKLLSSSVFFNKERILTTKTCDYQSTVRDCLGVEEYDFKVEAEDIMLNMLLGKNNRLELYIPLLYQDTDFIYQFAIVIEYQINNQTEMFIIDDFPYMKTSIFNSFYEEDCHVYTIKNNDS